MIEYDENGQEWFGYSFGARADDPEEVIATLLGNVQYVEWFFRQKQPGRQCSLYSQFEALFSSLPAECVAAITDDQHTLTKEIVRFRNRHAHGRFDEPALPLDRVHTLGVKVAALLFFSDMIQDGDLAGARASASKGSPYLRQVLGRTDKPV